MLTNPTIIINKDSIERFGYIRLNYELEDDDNILMTEGIGTCIGIFKGQTCFHTGGGYSYDLSYYCIGSFEKCSLLTSTTEPSQIPNQLSISPNPVSGVLRILNVKSPINNKLLLYDMHGRLLRTESNTDRINMENYRDGIYILQVKDDYENLHSFKVIKKK